MFMIYDDAGDKFGMPDADVEKVIRAAQALSQKINRQLAVKRIDEAGAVTDNVATVWPSGYVDLSLYGSTIA